MDSTNIRFHVYIFLCCLAGSITACQCKKTNEPAPCQGFVACTLDWRHAWPEYSLPHQLRYCFYSTESNTLIRMDSDQTDGMRFALPPGSYRVLIFNCEPETVPVQKIERFEESHAVLSGQTSADTLEIIARKPLYAIVIDTFVIAPGCDKAIRIAPVPMVKKITIQVSGKGIEAVEKCRGTLSGVTTAMRLYNRKKTTDPLSSLSFELQRTESGFEGKGIILNTSTSNPQKEELSDHRLAFDFTLKDGRTISSHADLKSIEDGTTSRGTPVDIQIEATFDTQADAGIQINCRHIPANQKLDIHKQQITERFISTH